MVVYMMMMIMLCGRGMKTVNRLGLVLVTSTVPWHAVCGHRVPAVTRCQPGKDRPLKFDEQHPGLVVSSSTTRSNWCVSAFTQYTLLLA